MVPADSGRISRVPPYSGAVSTPRPVFAYGTFTRCGVPFQTLRLTCHKTFVDGPTTPAGALPHRGFGLFRVRSPLLAKSLLFSSPPGNEMFQFPGFASDFCRMPDVVWRVAPFGNPRIKGYLLLHAAYRSLSRPSSPPRAKASFMCPSLLSYNVRLRLCLVSVYLSFQRLHSLVKSAL